VGIIRTESFSAPARYLQFSFSPLPPRMRYSFLTESTTTLPFSRERLSEQRTLSPYLDHCDVKWNSPLLLFLFSITHSLLLLRQTPQSLSLLRCRNQVGRNTVTPNRLDPSSLSFSGTPSTSSLPLRQGSRAALLTIPLRCDYLRTEPTWNRGLRFLESFFRPGRSKR